MNINFAIYKGTAKKSQTITGLLFIFLFGINNVFAAKTEIGIEELQKTYNQQFAEYNKSQNELKSIYAGIEASERQLKSKEEEKNTAASALKEIQRIDRDNPSLNLAENVAKARKRNHQAYQDYKNEDDQLKQLRTSSITLDRQVKDEIIKLNNIARDIKQAHDKIVAKEVEKRIALFKKTTLVEGYAEVGCSEDTPRKCQRRAINAAKRNAAEKGSIVVVKAATSIENFQLTRDQVKTEVQAQLSNIEVLEKGWKGDTTYMYRIKANVTPVISSSLRQQIEISIAHELGIVVPEEVSLETKTNTQTSNKALASAVPLTNAEKSFKELDEETGQAKVEEQAQTEKKDAANVANISDDSNDGIENWYTLWGVGYANNSYPTDKQDAIDSINDAGGDQISFGADLFGFYWPANRSTLYGVIVSTSFDILSIPNGTVVDGDVIDDFKLNINQMLYSVSTLNFLGNKIGKGFFLRADVGLARTASTIEFSVSGEKFSNDDSANGFGLLIGGGYGIPVSDESRILLGLNYSIKSIESDKYGTLAVNVSGLW